MGSFSQIPIEQFGSPSLLEIPEDEELAEKWRDITFEYHLPGGKRGELDSIFEDDSDWEPGEPASSDTIWRYMGFTQFNSILEREQLWFSNITQFKDPYEGTIPTKNAKKKAEKLKGAIDEHIGKDSNLDVNDPVLLEMASKPPFDGYVNCWNLNDHQSVALWEQYLEGPQGVAIKTTVEKLRESIEDPDYEIHHGEVKYIDYDSYEIPEGRLPILYHKRKSFEHEDEYRLSFVKDGDDGANVKGEYIDVDLEVLIEDVYLSPTSTDWYHDLVTEVADTYGLDCDIHESGLYAEPGY